MSDQLIISVGRQFGSGGHEIADMLAGRFGLPLYDKNLLHEMAESSHMDAAKLEKYDEHPKNHLFSRQVNGYSNSPEENIANMQFDYLRRLAAEGKSFVIVGRCSEAVLRQYAGKGLVRIFVLADTDFKTGRVRSSYNISEKEAREMIVRIDRQRKQYHNMHCDCKWGDARNYDICVNSGLLGTEETADYLETYILAAMRHVNGR